jgi:uncharacterized protein (TIGR02145 family)
MNFFKQQGKALLLALMVVVLSVGSLFADALNDSLERLVEELDGEPRGKLFQCNQWLLTINGELPDLTGYNREQLELAKKGLRNMYNLGGCSAIHEGIKQWLVQAGFKDGFNEWMKRIKESMTQTLGSPPSKYTQLGVETVRESAAEKARKERAAEEAKAKEEQAEREKQEVKQARLEREKIKNSRQPFTDTRDGKKYLTVKIGGKTWMAENLNYKIGKSWCYDKQNSNCDKYGRLYDFKTALLKACPGGWHLPSSEDWTALVNSVSDKEIDGRGRMKVSSGEEIAGRMLKSASGWDGNNNGTDDYGFSAMPGGYHDNKYGKFRDGGGRGYWWIAVTKETMEDGNVLIMGGYRGSDITKSIEDGEFSVRCVAD